MDFANQGYLHHLKHAARSSYHQRKRSGGDADRPLLMLGLVTVALGVTMVLNAWNRMHPEGRGR